MSAEAVPIWQMWATFALIAIAIVAYVRDALPLEVTSVSIIAALLLLFQFAPVTDDSGASILDTRTLLAGFADPALAAVVALLVVGQGLIRTGALDGVVQRLTRTPRSQATVAMALLLGAAAVLSAGINNTPVIIIFIPIAAAVATHLRTPASGLMMPLSFATILGGATTLIGSSTNLLVAGVAEAGGLEPLRFFDFFVPAIVLAGIGLVYVILIVPRLLPDRSSMTTAIVDGEGRHYIAQVRVRGIAR